MRFLTEGLPEWLQAVLAVIAVTLVVVLASAHRTLRNEYSDFVEYVRYPHPGAYVPRLNVVALGGDSIVVGETAGGAQLLVVFTTTCPYCLRSLPAWKALHDELNEAKEGVQFVGLALDSLHRVEAYQDEHRLPFPVAPLLDRRSIELLRARAVPMIVLVDADGRVRFARRGVLEGAAQLDSVFTALKAAVEGAPSSGAPAV